MSFSGEESGDDFSEKEADYKLFDVHNPVFWPSIALILILIVTTLSLGDKTQVWFESAQNVISNICKRFLDLFVVYCF